MNTPSVSAKVIADKPCPIRGGRVADDWNFSEDRRKTNPGLHLLYTASAIKHLLAISECIAEAAIIIDSIAPYLQENLRFDLPNPESYIEGE